MISRTVCLALLGASLVGCMSAEAREAQAVLVAIDTLRDSDPEDLTNRHKLIDALTKHPATSPLALEARDRCAEAYRLVVETKEGMVKMKAEMERLKEAPKNAAADFAAVEEKLEKSQPAMQACQKAIIELRVKYRK